MPTINILIEINCNFARLLIYNSVSSMVREELNNYKLNNLYLLIIGEISVYLYLLHLRFGKHGDTRT